jgi:hypothetical protein
MKPPNSRLENFPSLPDSTGEIRPLPEQFFGKADYKK